jgi:hypothetical protein
MFMSLNRFVHDTHVPRLVKDVILNPIKIIGNVGK